MNYTESTIAHQDNESVEEWIRKERARMSTKCTIFYRKLIHIYRDQMDDRIHVEFFFGRKRFHFFVR